MKESLRDTTFGQFARLLFGKEVLPHPEETSTFDATSITFARKDSYQGERSSKEDYLVGWYSDYDSANPQNWGSAKKGYIVLVIALYTFTVYMGSAVYFSSIPGIMEQFDVSEVVASLGLAVYVVGFGIGPMIFSPLSEIPSFGRNLIYSSTLLISLLFMVGAALAPNFGSLVVFRFLAAFFGSPAMATGGATMQDMYSVQKLPYGFAAWVAAATMGPAIGPTLGGFSAQAKDWRWPLWIQVWLAAPVLVLMLFTIPETSEGFILKGRAKRLRNLHGMQGYRSAGEVEEAEMTASSIVREAIFRPLQIAILDTGTGFINVYLAFVYAIYYVSLPCGYV